jgi:hypothetical protein
MAEEIFRLFRQKFPVELAKFFYSFPEVLWSLQNFFIPSRKFCGACKIFLFLPRSSAELAKFFYPFPEVLRSLQFFFIPSQKFCGACTAF